MSAALKISRWCSCRWRCSWRPGGWRPLGEAVAGERRWLVAAHIITGPLAAVFVAIDVPFMITSWAGWWPGPIPVEPADRPHHEHRDWGTTRLQQLVQHHRVQHPSLAAAATVTTSPPCCWPAPRLAAAAATVGRSVTCLAHYRCIAAMVAGSVLLNKVHSRAHLWLLPFFSCMLQLVLRMRTWPLFAGGHGPWVSTLRSWLAVPDEAMIPSGLQHAPRFVLIGV